MPRLSFLLTLILTFPLRAENWPFFRGPSSQGVTTETNLPLTWSKTDHLAWSTDVPGTGWSSPIVWDNRVFVTSTLENGASCHVICLDRDTGKILWDKEALRQKPGGRKEDKNSHATATPVTVGAA